MKGKPISERIDIYCDGPTLQEITELDQNIIRGYTFNPTLFRNLGVVDYLQHCRTVVKACGQLPVSLEVFADDEAGMIRQASILNQLGETVYVKIPITYTSGKSTLSVIENLSRDKVKLNITAIFTLEQVNHILPTLKNSGAILSVFSGRLFDIGRDATEETAAIVKKVHAESNGRVLWASPRMVFDIKSACVAGCDIITMQNSLIKKLVLFEKSREDYSLETVKMFYQDAVKSGYVL